MKFQFDEGNKKRKKKNDGWSWFERVKMIPMGDETIPLQTFNNSVDFGAISPDGGNMVATNSGTGVGMGVGEALEKLNEMDRKNVEDLLPIYYRDILLQYIAIEDNLRKLQKEKHSLLNSGNKPNNSLIGAIKRHKEQLRDLESKIDYHLDIGSLMNKARKFTNKELGQVLSQEERELVVDYINNKEIETKKTKGRATLQI